MKLSEFKKGISDFIEQYEKENDCEIVDISIFTETMERPLSGKKIVNRTITVSIQ